MSRLTLTNNWFPIISSALRVINSCLWINQVKSEIVMMHFFLKITGFYVWLSCTATAREIDWMIEPLSGFVNVFWHLAPGCHPGLFILSHLRGSMRRSVTCRCWSERQCFVHCFIYSSLTRCLPVSLMSDLIVCIIEELQVPGNKHFFPVQKLICISLFMSIPT